MILDAATRKIVTFFRVFLGHFFPAIAIAAGFAGQEALPQTAYHLQLDQNPGCRRVETMLQADGQLLTGEGESRRSAPIRITGQLAFFETSTKTEKEQTAAAARHYVSAEAEIIVDGRTEKSSLSSTRRSMLLVQSAEDAGVAVFSPLGPMTRDDLELVSTQCDPLLLGAVLPEEPVAPEQKWPVTNEHAAALFGLDEVSRCNLRCTLKNVDAGSAHVLLVGSVSGKALGANSELQVDGEITFDRRRRWISGVNVQIKEKREVGLVAPGFEIEAHIATQIEPAEAPPELAADEVANLSLEPTAAKTALDFASPALGLAFIHDRRWRVTQHRRDALVLRMVDQGQFVAQCNITPLRPAVDEHPVEMAKFRAQVEESLSRYGGKIDEASQATTDDGLQILRIAASAQVKETPIVWYHYLLTHEDGRRLVVVFTITGEQEAEFDTADHDLIGSLRFLDREASARGGSGHRSR